MQVLSQYRLTLYRRAENRWQYCQLTAADTGWLQKGTGWCGISEPSTEYISLPSGSNPYQAVLDAGAGIRTEGYDYPRRSDLKILSIHFQVSPWTGFPAAAPWFEDWKTYYQEPFEEILNKTVNGFSRGMHRSRGHVVLYYYVINEEAAWKAAEAVNEAAPVKFSMHLHLGDEEFRPEQKIHRDVPKPLAGLFEQFGAMANTVAEASHNILFHSVALTPQLITPPSRQRIKGAAAYEVKRQLHTRWNFECGNWPPTGGSSPEAVISLSEWTLESMELLHERLLERLQHPAYLMDCDDGVFALEPGHLLRGVYEGAVFDASFEWIVYFSHQHTVTFAGEWLLGHVRDLFALEYAL